MKGMVPITLPASRFLYLRRSGGERDFSVDEVSTVFGMDFRENLSRPSSS